MDFARGTKEKAKPFDFLILSDKLIPPDKQKEHPIEFLPAQHTLFYGFILEPVPTGIKIVLSADYADFNDCFVRLQE
ncbi:MAG: hypothetical protein WCT05_09740 [Lentisphaeria bacterium]